MDIKLIGINARYTHSCLALFYVRNELLVHCPAMHVAIEQFTINDSYYELLLNITRGNPDYIFFSAAVWNSDLIIKLVADIQNCFPGSRCVVGGPQAEIISRHPRLNGLTTVIGEIERVDPGFYRDLAMLTPLPQYQCRAVRKGFSAPYLPSDFDKHLQNRHVYYETSRGCVFSCTYCLSSVRKGVFHKDLEAVKDELNVLLRYNPAVVRFVDRTFNDNSQRTLELWQFLAGYDCDTTFHFEINPDRFNQDMFDLLRQLPVGKFQFEIGIQSTHQQTLDAVRRPMQTEEAHDIITRLRDFDNIHLHADLILGLPYETRDSFLQSFRDVFAMRPHYIQMGLLKILPDTAVCHTAAENDYCYSAVPPYAVFSSKWIGAEDLRQLFWFCECVEKFLNNRYFLSLWNYFRQTSIDIAQFFLQLLERCQAESFFQHAATQERMCSLLIDNTTGWPDHSLVIELLRYDWLRCGHRFLPEKLDLAEEDRSSAIKRKLFHHHSLDDGSSITQENLSYWFKKGFFASFSGEAAEYLGFAAKNSQHFCCFLPDRDNNLFSFSKVVRFSLPMVPMGERIV